MKRSFSSTTDGDEEDSKVLELQYTTPYGKVIHTFGTSSSKCAFKRDKRTHSTKMVDPYGGATGEKFDDGVFDGVKKLVVGEDNLGVVYIKSVYVKDGLDVHREHGTNTGKQRENEFEVDYPDEYITSIWGLYRDNRYEKKSFWEDEYGFPVPFDDDEYDDDDGEINSAVSSLRFTTSHSRQSVKFGDSGSGGTEFVLEGKNGTKLVGLCGISGDFLDALGAHFAFIPSTFKQFEPLGGSHGFSWDDGVFDRVKKVCIGEDEDHVSFLEFEYAKGDQSIVFSHGKKPPQERNEFVLDYDEYITSVMVTHNHDGFISSLSFITSSKERKLEVFGKVGTTKFTLVIKGFERLVGFRGRSSLDGINALGANFAVEVAHPIRKLEAQGGDYGNETEWVEWDDGIHDGVHKIVVSYNGPMVHAVKFVYVNGYANETYQTVNGDCHGSISASDFIKEGMLWFGTEYITAVEGHYGFKRSLYGENLADQGCYITRLKFTTNLSEVIVLGSSTPDYEYIGTSFRFEEAGHEIVGFHGTSTSRSLRKLGVYVQPIYDV